MARPSPPRSSARGRSSSSSFIALFHNVGSAIGAKVAGLLLGIVAYGLLARTVGTAGLGGYRTVLTLLLFAGVMFDFGLYSITLRDISQPQADKQRILGNAVALRIAATSESSVPPSASSAATW